MSLYITIWKKVLIYILVDNNSDDKYRQLNGWLDNLMIHYLTL